MMIIRMQVSRNSPNVTAKANQGETTRIFAKDSDTYRAIVYHFEEVGIEYIYQIQTEKPHRIVVRGLDHSTLNKDIKDSLKAVGYEVLYIHNSISKDNREKLKILLNIKACAEIN